MPHKHLKGHLWHGQRPSDLHDIENGLSDYNFVIPGACSGSVCVCVCACLGLRCHFSGATHPYPWENYCASQIIAPLWKIWAKRYCLLNIIRKRFLFFYPRSERFYTNLMRASERHVLLHSLSGDREQQSRSKSISQTIWKLHLSCFYLLFSFRFDSRFVKKFRKALINSAEQPARSGGDRFFLPGTMLEPRCYVGMTKAYY